MPFQTPWLRLVTRIDPDTRRSRPQIAPTTATLTRKTGIRGAGRSKPVLSATAERCQSENARLVQTRTLVSFSSARSREARSSLERNPPR